MYSLWPTLSPSVDIWVIILIMVTKKEKVVAISGWYFLQKIIVNLGIFLIFFFLFSILFLMFASSDPNLGLKSLILSGIVSLLVLFNDLLYFSQSGIYITDKGDHVIKIGGYFSQESKLLNGIVVANNVRRGPLDQLFGLATIQAGMFQDTDKSLVGVRYKNIEKYDDMMRSGGLEKFISFF